MYDETTHIKDMKYVCPDQECGFESPIAGYCPVDDENYMRKICECDSGMYASTCCEPELEKVEKEMESKVEEELQEELKKEIKQSKEEEELLVQEEEEIFDEKD